jgi:hypothetical protein
VVLREWQSGDRWAQVCMSIKRIALRNVPCPKCGTHAAFRGAIAIPHNDQLIAPPSPAGTSGPTGGGAPA